MNQTIAGLGQVYKVFAIIVEQAQRMRPILAALALMRRAAVKTLSCHSSPSTQHCCLLLRQTGDRHRLTQVLQQQPTTTTAYPEAQLQALSSARWSLLHYCWHCLPRAAFSFCAEDEIEVHPAVSSINQLRNDAASAYKACNRLGLFHLRMVTRFSLEVA